MVNWWFGDWWFGFRLDHQKWKGLLLTGIPKKFPNHQFTNSWLGAETSNILYFHPYLGKIFTHFDVRIFFRWVGGFNHRCHLIFRNCRTKNLRPKSDQLGGETSNILYFHPYLGKSSNLANIFPMGWFNHQLAKVLQATRGWKKQHWDVGGFQPLSSPKLFWTFQGWPIESIGEITIQKKEKGHLGEKVYVYIYIWYSINMYIVYMYTFIYTYVFHQPMQCALLLIKSGRLVSEESLGFQVWIQEHATYNG